MSEDRRCEACGALPPVIDRGPFAGSRHMLDYCDACSKDLCDSCMASTKCRDTEDGKHLPHNEDDE